MGAALPFKYALQLSRADHAQTGQGPAHVGRAGNAPTPLHPPNTHPPGRSKRRQGSRHWLERVPPRAAAGQHGTSACRSRRAGSPQRRGAAGGGCTRQAQGLQGSLGWQAGRLAGSLRRRRRLGLPPRSRNPGSGCRCRGRAGRLGCHAPAEAQANRMVRSLDAKSGQISGVECSEGCTGWPRPPLRAQGPPESSPHDAPFPHLWKLGQHLHLRRLWLAGGRMEVERGGGCRGGGAADAKACEGRGGGSPRSAR
jgi:hypothetical protein